MYDISMVSCQKGPTRHAYAWQIGPFWQDTLDIWGCVCSSVAWWYFLNERVWNGLVGTRSRTRFGEICTALSITPQQVNTYSHKTKWCFLQLFVVVLVLYHFVPFLRLDSLCGFKIHISKRHLTTRLDKPHSPNNLWCKCFQLLIVMVRTFLNGR